VARSISDCRYIRRSPATPLLNVRARRLSEERRQMEMAAKKKAAKKSTKKAKKK